MPKYEITAPGFDGSNDKTDNLVLWVSSDLAVDVLASKLKADGVQDKDIDLVVLPDDAEVDFDYPAQQSEMKEEVAFRCFHHIINLIEGREVIRFNYDKELAIAIDGGMIVVRRPGSPEYYFNEHGALEAVFGKDQLTMPDAQGFPCTFYFSPRKQVLVLPTQEDQVAFATGHVPENILQRIFNNDAEVEAYRDGLEALEDENDELSQIEVNGGTVHIFSSSRDEEEGDTIEFDTEDKAFAYQQGVEDSNGFNRPVAYGVEDAEFAKLQALFSAKQIEA